MQNPRYAEQIHMMCLLAMADASLEEELFAKLNEENMTLPEGPRREAAMTATKYMRECVRLGRKQMDGSFTEADRDRMLELQRICEGIRTEYEAKYSEPEGS